MDGSGLISSHVRTRWFLVWLAVGPRRISGSRDQWLNTVQQDGWGRVQHYRSSSSLRLPLNILITIYFFSFAAAFSRWNDVRIAKVVISVYNFFFSSSFFIYSSLLFECHRSRSASIYKPVDRFVIKKNPLDPFVNQKGGPRIVTNQWTLMSGETSWMGTWLPDQIRLLLDSFWWKCRTIVKRTLYLFKTTREMFIVQWASRFIQQRSTWKSRRLTKIKRLKTEKYSTRLKTHYYAKRLTSTCLQGPAGFFSFGICINSTGVSRDFDFNWQIDFSWWFAWALADVRQIVCLRCLFMHIFTSRWLNSRRKTRNRIVTGDFFIPPLEWRSGFLFLLTRWRKINDETDSNHDIYSFFRTTIEK